MFTSRTLQEGRWPIVILVALSVATALVCPVRWAPIPPVALLAFTISFFRDPRAFGAGRPEDDCGAGRRDGGGDLDG